MSLWASSGASPSIPTVIVIVVVPCGRANHGAIRVESHAEALARSTRRGLVQPLSAPPPPSSVVAPVAAPVQDHSSAAVASTPSSRSTPECNFCKNGGAPVEFYTSHALRCPITHRLLCPKLRSIKCENCK
jgi:hypothetical protein